MLAVSFIRLFIIGFVYGLFVKALPTDVKAIQILSTSITISWNSNDSKTYNVTAVKTDSTMDSYGDAELRISSTYGDAELPISSTRVNYTIAVDDVGNPLVARTNYTITIFDEQDNSTSESFSIITGPPKLVDVSVTQSNPNDLEISFNDPDTTTVNTRYNVIYKPTQEENISGRTVHIQINSTSPRKSVVLRDLEPNTAYTIEQVVTITDKLIVHSDPTAPINGSTAPGPVLNLTVTENPSTVLNVTWSKPVGGDDIDKYMVDIQVKEVDENPVIIPKIHVKDEQQYSITVPLIPGEIYSIRVFAFNSAGESNDSLFFRTDPPKPQSVELLRPTGQNPVTSLTLKWHINASTFEISKYSVRLYADNGLTIITRNITVGNATNYEFTDFILGQSYAAEIQAISSSGNLPETSSGFSNRTQQQRTDPPTPLNVTLSQPLDEDKFNNQLLLKWEFLPNQNYTITSYTAILQPGQEVSFSVAINTSQDNEHVLQNLTPGESYSATLQSISSGEGPKALSNVSKSSASKRTNPNPPQNVVITTITSSTIHINFTSPSGIFNGFELFMSHSGFEQSFRNLTNVTSYEIKDLEPNSFYRFALRTQSGNSSQQTVSVLSNEVTNNTRPGIPTNITVQQTAATESRVNVYFSVPQNNATSYVVVFKVRGEQEIGAKQYSGFPPVMVQNLIPGEQYEVSVFGQGTSGDGLPSTPVYFVLG